MKNLNAYYLIDVTQTMPWNKFRGSEIPTVEAMGEHKPSAVNLLSFRGQWAFDNCAFQCVANVVRNIGCLIVVAALLWVTAALPAQAAPKPKLTQSQITQSQIQADGIVAGVVDKLWSQTDEYWHHGDYPRIVALDRIITEADPQFLEAYANGGWLMDSLGRTDDAEAYYTLGTRNNPQAEYAYWNLGMFYFNTKHNYRAAAQAMQSAVSQPNADLNDWKMLGHSYEKSHQWDKAVATWQQIKARYPNGLAVDRLLAEAIEKRREAVARGEKTSP